MKQVQEHLGKLGLKAEDMVTGFKGVVSTVSFDLYGCIQAVLTPPTDKNGVQPDSRYYDMARLKFKDGAKPVMPVPNFVAGPVARGEQGAAEKPAFDK